MTNKIGSGATPRGGESVYLPLRDKFALIRSQNVFDHRFETDGLAFISDKQAAELANAQVRSGDVLLNITGDGVTFARACLVPDDILPACVNQHVSIVRANPSLVDPGYLVAYLAHPSTKGYIESFNAGGSRRAITKGHIESFQLPIPPLSEQKQLGTILGTIGRKIELNRHVNGTLEAIARAIFKSWFVDFDPVRAKAEGRYTTGSKSITDIFPSGFENSERGLVPKGWNFKTVGEVTDRVGMGPFGASIKVETFVSEGIPIISGQHLRRFVLDDNTFNFITDEHAERLANAIVRRGDVIFTHAGNIGQVALIPSNSRYDRYVLSQRQFFMRCNLSQITPTFSVLYFSSAAGQQALLANTSSSGVPSIARPVTYLRSVRLLVPPKGVLDAFQSVVEPLIQKLRQNDDENEALVSVRDFLLPKVMSGEIRIKDAEKIIEAQA